MAQYIDKDALVAEIDKQKIGYNVDGKHSVEYDITRKILNIIDTIGEVKEVDLEKEIDDWYNTMGIPVTTDALKETARYFFELGLNTQQNINITNIDEIIEENGVDPNSKEAKMFKESYYMALERFKAQKGE